METLVLLLIALTCVFSALISAMLGSLHARVLLEWFSDLSLVIKTMNAAAIAILFFGVVSSTICTWSTFSIYTASHIGEVLLAFTMYYLLNELFSVPLGLAVYATAFLIMLFQEQQAVY